MRPRFFTINFISFLAFLFLANSGPAFGQNFLITEDVSLDWVFYDEGEKTMLPFLANNKQYPVSMHLSVDLDKGKQAYLMLEIPENASLFIQNKFISHHDKSELKYYSLDSLRNVFKIDNLQLTLYNNARFSYPSDAKIGFIHKTLATSVDVNPVLLRHFDDRSDYLKMIILLLFTFFVVLYSLFPAELLDFFSLRRLFTFRFTNTALTKYRSLTKTQTLVIFYEAMLLAGILIIFLNYYSNPVGEAFFLKINPIWGWLLIFGIVLLLVFLKYILISIVSALFGLVDRINFYFVEYLRMSMIFYSILFIIISYTIINKFYILDVLLDGLIISVIIFNLMRLVVLYFKFRRSISMKSLHLFSYLCATELIPIVIGLKFFLK